MVAGVHYPDGEDPATVARRLLRVNLSDLAAMGAEASAYALGLALPEDAGDAWVEAFAAGLAQDQDAFGVALVGGDTVAARGPAVLSLTAFGWVAGEACLTRAGAGEGDDIYVSGTIGDAALGLRAVQGDLPALAAEDRAALAARFRLPEPRLALGAALVGVATCAIDVSDGLVAGPRAHLRGIGSRGTRHGRRRAVLGTRAARVGCGDGGYRRSRDRRRRLRAALLRGAVSARCHRGPGPPPRPAADPHRDRRARPGRHDPGIRRQAARAPPHRLHSFLERIRLGRMRFRVPCAKPGAARPRAALAPGLPDAMTRKLQFKAAYTGPIPVHSGP